MTFPSPALECRNLAGEITHVSVVAASPGAGIEPGQQRGPHLVSRMLQHGGEADSWMRWRELLKLRGKAVLKEGCQMLSLHIRSCSWYTCLLPVPGQAAGESLSRG